MFAVAAARPGARCRWRWSRCWRARAVFTAAAVTVQSLAFWLGEHGAARAPGVGVHAGLQPLSEAAVQRVDLVPLYTLIPAGFVGFLPVELVRAPSLALLGACSPPRWAGRLLALLVFHAGLRRYAVGQPLRRAPVARPATARYTARSRRADAVHDISRARARPRARSVGGQARVAARAAQARRRALRSSARRPAAPRRRPLRQRRRVRAHHRRAAGHRLEHGQPEALVQARHRADARSADQRDELRLGHADQAQRCARACPCDRAPPRPRPRRRCRGRPARAAARAAARWPRSASGSSCAARAGRSRSRSRRASRAASPRAPAPPGGTHGVDPQVDRVYPVRRDAEHLGDPARRERAVGDDVVRARDRVADLAAVLLVRVGGDPLRVPHRVQIVDRHQLRHARGARHEHAHRVEERRAAQQQVVQRIGDQARVRVGRVGLQRSERRRAAEPVQSR